jgi:type VI secretion system secreted protein Hcp
MNRSLFRPLSLAAALVCFLAASVTRAAESVSLTLVMNDVQIQGENPLTSLGRENTIDCLSWESEFFRTPGARDAVHRPVKIVKRIDKSTPLLAKAFDSDHTGTATFRFFRPNPNGDGTTEQFFTVILTDTRITSERMLLPSTITPATATSPPLEEVTFSYSSIKIIYTNGGIETEIRVR